MGCGASGTLHFSIENDVVKFVLQDCAFTKGFDMTGTGSYDSATDHFKLLVKVDGEVNCRLQYERVGSHVTLNGDCDGLAQNASGQAEPEMSIQPKHPRVVPHLRRLR